MSDKRTSRRKTKIMMPFLLWIPVMLLCMRAAYASQPHEAIVTTTKDGQQVIFVVSSFVSMKIYNDVAPARGTWPGGEERRSLQEKWLKEGIIPVQPFPFRIIDDVYALEYGHPKHEHQRIYLVDCGDGYLLIDPSYVEFQEMVEDNLRKLGVSDGEVKWVLNTHCHIDHAAASLYWRRKGARIIAPEGDAYSIESGNQITAYYLNAFGPKTFAPCPVDIIVKDADELKLGNKTFFVIATPGHTPGSSCFWLVHEGKNILFSEDIVLYHGQYAWMGHPYADWEQYLKSIYKLKHFRHNGERIRFDALLPGHGSMVLNNASHDIDLAIRIVEEIMKDTDIEKRNAQTLDPYLFLWRMEHGKKE